MASGSCWNLCTRYSRKLRSLTHLEQKETKRTKSGGQRQDGWYPDLRSGCSHKRQAERQARRPYDRLARLSLLEVGGGEKAWKSAFDLQRSAPKLLFEQFAFLADFGRGLRWQFPTQKRQQQLVVLFGLRVATKYQLPPVGGWEVHVQHLDGRELFQ